MAAFGPRWSQPEVERLEDLAGDQPMNTAIKAFRRWARANGYPDRTPRAIAKAAQTRRLTLRPTGAMVSSGALQQALGVTYGRAALIVSLCGAFQPNPGGRRYVTRVALRHLARREPQWFAGGDRQGLVFLLEDADLVDFVLEHRPAPASLSLHPVRCIESGAVFESVAAASRSCFISPQSIRYALRTGKPTGGLHFESIR